MMSSTSLSPVFTLPNDPGESNSIPAVSYLKRSTLVILGRTILTLVIFPKYYESVLCTVDKHIVRLVPGP